jgi:hypothetical protein
MFYRTKTAFREIANYLFTLDVIDKNIHTETWKSLNLRIDLIGRMYTVVSLREEDMGDGDDVKRFKVLEKMRPINEYLTSLGLQEIIVPNITVIKDSRSYLITYSPIFEQFSWTWLIVNVIFPIGIAMQFLLF